MSPGDNDVAQAVVVAASQRKAPPPPRYAESIHNLALLDPPRFGWTAAGTIANLSEPHERARSRSAKSTFLSEIKRKRDAAEAFGGPSQQTQRITDTCVEYHAPLDTSTAISSLTNPLASTSEQAALASDSTTASVETSCQATTNKIADDAPRPKVNDGDANPISFRAWSSTNTLDMYTYHRGREGLELRDSARGGLLCDVTATDTNYGRDEAESMIATVTIQFPVREQKRKDPEVCKAAKDDNDEQNTAEPMQYYRETIHWDLEDVETPPPPVFAAYIAEQYGLTLRETLELTESIQSQLYTFASDCATYSAALPIKDAFGQRRDVPLSHVYSLYGETLASIHGGTVIPKQQLKLRTTRQATATRSSAVAATVSAGASSTSSSFTGRSLPKSNAVKKVCKTSGKVEAEYVEEIQRRLQCNSIVTCRQRNENNLGLKIAQGGFCHICRTEKKETAIFLCGKTDHGMCDGHLLQFHGMSMHALDTCRLDHCPICSLSCPCSWCGRLLDRMAALFKQRCCEQGKSVGEIKFEDMTEQLHELEQQVYTTFRKSSFGMLRVVRKVPVDEFPKETFDGQDLHPGTNADYQLVFTAEGSFTSSENLVATETCNGVAQLDARSTPTCSPDKVGITKSLEGLSPSRDIASIEDGSVDHCILCMQCGDLLCCDKCPRAYHSRCIQCEYTPAGSSWECPACQREIAGIPEEEIDGHKYLGSVIAAFCAKVDITKPMIMNELKVISAIYAMLQYLIQYDFGYMFSAPVNTIDVPLYSTVVKEPMDLGTILDNIMKGGYNVHVRKETLEDVIIRALNDIYLVWHNCFLFNAAGSAVYRMAQVQRAAADRVMNRSISGMLSSAIKIAVQDYRESSDIHRRQLLQATNSAKSKLEARRSITVKPRDSAKGRTVAVLDSDTGRIVKIYATVSSAIIAAGLFLDLGYACEWDLVKGKDHGQTIRRIVNESSTRVEFRLFGYRWLYLLDLKAGRVRFPKIETKQHSYLTNTQDECMLDADTRGTLSKYNAHSTNSPSSKRIRNGALGEGLSSEEFSMVKKDEVSGAILNGFHTLDTAYQDWLESLGACSNDADVIKTPETFRTYYLDGKCDVGGAIWRTTPAKNIFPDSNGLTEEHKTHRPEMLRSSPSTGMPNDAVVDGESVANTSISQKLKQNGFFKLLF